MTKVTISKKLVAMATVIVMLIAMVIPAAAAPDQAEGTITVHKFAGTSLVEATNNYTGEALESSDSNHPLNNGYSALDGAEFTLFILPQEEVNAVNAAITATNKVTGHTISTAGAAPVVTFSLWDSATSTPTTVNITGVNVDVQTTANGGVAEFGQGTPLVDGYYVLVETDTPTGHLTAAPSLIRLPLTDSEGNRNFNVHVYPKNISNADIAVKDVDGLVQPVSNGQSVTFSLKAVFTSATVATANDLRATEAPSANATDYGTAKITETFSTQFRYNADSLKVFWLDATGSIDAGAELTAAQWTNTTLPTTPGGEFSVQLTPEGIDAAIEGGKGGFGLVLAATYVGTASAASGNTPEGVLNTMSAIMTEPGGNDESVEDVIFIPSLAVLLDKTTSAVRGSEPMENVVFALLTQAIAGLNYDPDAAAGTYTEAQLLAAGYILAPESTPTDGKALIATTDENGQLVFSNLDGYTNEDGVEFWLKELVTLPGYQLKHNTIKVTFADQATYFGVHGNNWFGDANNWLTDIQVNESVTVENYELDERDPDDAGFSLPLTGGAGTMIFTAIGIVVMLGAAIVYLRGKKKNI